MNTQDDRAAEIFAKSIFSEAVRLSNPAARNAYLDNACGRDGPLRREVESLLSAHDQAGSFLERTKRLPTPDFSTEHPDLKIGRYQLLQQVGEGGFGTVWMAQQLEPVQRKVALKIIKPGMDTKEVIARFEVERQALALMDHPNIAQVLDAGVTPAGRPYFVMELIEGLPITDYCDREKLSTNDRLRLFLKVCQAVQHAHQKGIIHRDLKPRNVLVKLQDGEAVPKVIDFGVAKALGQKLTERTIATARHHLIGTPAYMSPEQAELSGLDVDTRSDIYSLGVMLYELLTGVTPVDGEALGKAGWEELRRMICEVEPVKPSSRLSRLSEAQAAASATQRRVDPSKLRRLIRGDLDWIVMKALEKEQNRRYQAAIALIQDLERHLRNEPVTAVAPTLAYRAGKFIRRHRVAVAVSGVILCILGAGIGVAARLTTRAAEAERARLRLGTFLRDSIEQRVRNVLLLETRTERFKAIGEIQENMPHEALDVAVALLKSDDEKIRRRAGYSLFSFRAIIGEKVGALADHMLHNPDPDVRLSCAAVLMPVRSPIVDKVYAKAVFDPTEKVAQLSCAQSGWRATPDGTEALFQVLTNRSWDIRFTACAALVNQKTADQRVVATLEALAREPEAVEHDKQATDQSNIQLEKVLTESLGEKYDSRPDTVGSLLERARALAEAKRQ
jgi:hypothetical protein